MLTTYSMKEGLVSVSLHPLLKKLGRSSYDATMAYYDIMLILFLLRLVANAQYL